MTRRLLHIPRFVLLMAVLLSSFPSAQAQEWIYSVRPGDTLWDLSEALLKDASYWRRIQTLNDVLDPENLAPGTRLRIPVSWLKIQPVPAKVVAATGPTEVYLAATDVTVPMTPGMLLYGGDAVITAINGSATVEFADGSRLLVGATSYLVMDELTSFGSKGMVDTRVRLKSGRTDSQILRQKGGGSRFQIWTPAAVSAVRGTDFRVGVMDEGRKATTEVLKGRVDVAGSSGSPVRVREGFGTVVRSDAAPSRPIRLLEPPDLSAVPDVIDRLPMRFGFAPVAGAVAYRVEVAPTDLFEALLVDEVVEGPRAIKSDLADGVYFLRIRAIDRQGLEGLNGQKRIVVNARPEPPIPLDPVDEATIREVSPTFQWSKPEGAVAYHFQLAAGTDFSEPIIDLPGQDATRFVAWRPLDYGEYSWRAATIDHSGEVGPFSDAQKFRVSAPPSSPAAAEPEVSEDRLILRWRRGTAEQKYRVQLARNPGFDSVVEDQIVAEPELSIDRPVPGTYFVRVRTVEPDGYEGPFGVAQQIDVPPSSYWPIAVFPLLFLLFLL